MLGLLLSNSLAPTAHRRLTQPLQVECLDDRIVPSAASFSDLQGRIIGSNIIVFGRVLDDTDGADVVYAAGAVSGACTATSTGKFEFIVPYKGNGVATLFIRDDEGIDSAQHGISVQPSFGDAAPYVSFSEAYGANRTVTFSGIVYDEAPGDCKISITGAASASNIHPNAEGSFTVTVTADSLGYVYAEAIDFNGGHSNTDFCRLVNHEPDIDEFGVERIEDNRYRLYGHVSDETVWGIAVYFGGISSVQNLDAICDANGYFEREFTRSSSDVGYITADCFDWWGLAADQESVYLN